MTEFSPPPVKHPRIGFVGLGHMACHLIEGFAASGLTSANLFGLSKGAIKHPELSQIITLCHALPELLAEVDWLVICVKPKDIPALLSDLKAACTESISLPLIWSVAAGISHAFYESMLPNCNIIRLMPNLPVACQQGVLGIYDPQQALSEANRATWARLGTVITVDDDQALDALTALSGSGPAFWVHLFQSYVTGAKQLGFDEDTAKQITLQTISGALSLAANADDWQALVQAVTSKGGTTEAGLEAMLACDGASVLPAALTAAVRRATMLNESASQEK